MNKPSPLAPLPSRARGIRENIIKSKQNL